MATSGHWRSGAPSCVFKIHASAIALAFIVFISTSIFFTCWSHSVAPPPVVVSKSKESFDTKLKIQKLKDTIFAGNEQLTKAEKQGDFASFIVAK